MKYSFSIERENLSLLNLSVRFGFLLDFSFRSKNLSNFFFNTLLVIAAAITLSLFSLLPPSIKRHLTTVRIVILCLNSLAPHRKVKISLGGTMNIHDEYSHRVNPRVNLLNVSLKLLKEGDQRLYVITFPRVKYPFVRVLNYRWFFFNTSFLRIFFLKIFF